MQQFLMKVTEVVFNYSNKKYLDQTMSTNSEVMNKIINMTQTMTFKNILQMNLNDVNSYLTSMSYF